MRFARLWVSEVASQSPEGSLNLQETDLVSRVFWLYFRGCLGKARIPVGKMNASGCGFYDRKTGARTLGRALLPASVGLVLSAQPSFSLPFMTVDVSGTLISDNNIIGLNQLDLDPTVGVPSCWRTFQSRTRPGHGSSRQAKSRSLSICRQAPE